MGNLLLLMMELFELKNPAERGEVDPGPCGNLYRQIFYTDNASQCKLTEKEDFNEYN